MKVCEMGTLRGLAIAAVLSPLAVTASGQAPVITPAGDPSVRNDSIYSLAVDPSQYPDQAFVYLLDDGVVRFEADGRGSRTYRQVIQILTREAAETWGEQSFSYTSGRERLTVNWVRVVRPDGQVVSAKPTHEQESIASVAQESPVYSDVKVRRVSLGGVAPGTIVDYSFTVETLKPIMPGDYYTGWRVTTGRLTRRSRFILDVPATVTPVIKESNLGFSRQIREGRGRRVYTWATGEIPVLETEPFASDSNGLVGRIEVAAPIAWGDVARWYAGLARDRYTVTPELEARLKELVTGARTLEDSVRAVHRWVAQDFRYVSLSLGIGGFQPRPPASVYETRYGDCKDKATLFIALAQRLGVRAYPVLLSSTGGVDRSLPSGRQFDHMIAAVERPGGYLYLDLTADLTPFGALPPAEQGEFGLLVHPDGRGEQVTFPSDSLTSNRTEVSIVGELGADGSFAGRLTRTASGSEQYGLRSSLASSPQMSATDSNKVSRVIANGVFEGANGDSLELFDGRDLRAQPRVSLVIRSPDVLSNAGNTEILNLPLDNYTSSSLIADLEARGPRRYPIDAASVIGPHESVSELVLTLPQGWKARLPPEVNAESVFGSYRAEFTQAGRVLRVSRQLSGRKGIEPPERIGELIAWLKEISHDDARFLVLEHP